jgi:siroheme synthase-like protein
MSDLPIALHGERITAVVVGGGSVGTRKALALVETGAQVRVVAPDVTPELEAAERARGLTIVRDSYSAGHLDRSILVVAATDSREVNARIAVDAHSAGKLVNITDFPDEGNFHSMAIHRSGDVTIAVSSGGVPGAAARIRDAIAERFDERYERAVSALRALRSRLIAGGDSQWRDAAPNLIGDDFCSSVEDGSLADKVESWR